ncbi:MAG TPA: imidazole glycerol phosphate synthase subunit HisF [Xanthomonadaceae bacterium]|nr:imidazole glycerol phosphate synthase subunit HisF [Xanthomonadaceae bacterium]
MLKRRIVPCLDVREGAVVKGVRFRDHLRVGAIEELAMRYRDGGADELVFYDITASPQGRRVDRGWVERVARIIDIPFCVAGGIRSVEDARAVLRAGADKISINSPALENPALIGELAAAFGSQCVVVGIDSRRRSALPVAPVGARTDSTPSASTEARTDALPFAEGEGEGRGGVARRSRARLTAIPAPATDWHVHQYTGDPDRTRALPRRTLDWIAEVQDRGAGEIVLNCMDSDGVRAGFDLEQLRAARACCRVPLVASGGAGRPEHFRDAFAQADVDAALAASVFHSGAVPIPALKHYLLGQGVAVRP